MTHTARPAADIAAEFTPADGRVSFDVILPEYLDAFEYVGNGHNTPRGIRAGAIVRVTYNQGATNAGIKVFRAKTGTWMTREFHTDPARIFAATDIEVNAQRARVAARAARYASA